MIREWWWWWYIFSTLVIFSKVWFAIAWLLKRQSKWCFVEQRKNLLYIYLNYTVFLTDKKKDLAKQEMPREKQDPLIVFLFPSQKDSRETDWISNNPSCQETYIKLGRPKWFREYLFHRVPSGSGIHYHALFHLDHLRVMIP